MDDTRVLSHVILKVNDKPLVLLNGNRPNSNSAEFMLTVANDEFYQEFAFTVLRKRRLEESLVESIEVANLTDRQIQLMLSLHCNADFADVFELKTGNEIIKRKVHSSHSDRSLTFEYRHEPAAKKTVLQFSEPAKTADGTIYFPMNLAPKTKHLVEVVISIQRSESRAATIKSGLEPSEQPAWPVLTSDWADMLNAYQRSTADISALLYSPLNDGARVVAGGLPWLMALFGRDSLIVSYQACFLFPQLAKDTLTTLAQLQAKSYDDFRDMEPGKIPHELRFGELSQTDRIPFGPYYGSADATPLFLILLSEVFNWTRDHAFVERMRPAAMAALAWINEYGDADHDGYVEYKARSSKGLKNLCWKDSDNSILFANGSEAEAPLAVAEIQGYVYEAKARMAVLAKNVWNDFELAQRLEQQAKALKSKFNSDFWIDERKHFALALDRDKQQVDSCTSNMGQLLRTGIVDGSLVPLVVKRLFSEDMYSGFGIRTMSTNDEGYHPLTYHNGSVWPHDNSLIAEGLLACGYPREAALLSSGIMKVARYFGYRFPELFAGFCADKTEVPMPYPPACIPQAWACGTPLILLKLALGLKPDMQTKTVSACINFPEHANRLSLSGLNWFGTNYRLDVRGGNCAITETAISSENESRARSASS